MYEDGRQPPGQNQPDKASLTPEQKKLPKYRSLTAFFVHETGNALNAARFIQMMPDPETLGLTADDFAELKQRLLNVRAMLDVLPSEGFLSRAEIEGFLEQAHLDDEWNYQTIVDLYQVYLPLLRKVEEAEAAAAKTDL